MKNARKRTPEYHNRSIPLNVNNPFKGRIEFVF
jgi:hypothetical protein